MSWAALRPSSAAWRVRAVCLTFSSNVFRSALSRRYPLTGRGLRCLGGRLRLVLGETARLSEIGAYKRISPWLSRMIHRVRFGDPVCGRRNRGRPYSFPAATGDGEVETGTAAPDSGAGNGLASVASSESVPSGLSLYGTPAFSAMSRRIPSRSVDFSPKNSAKYRVVVRARDRPEGLRLMS